MSNEQLELLHGLAAEPGACNLAAVGRVLQPHQGVSDGNT